MQKRKILFGILAAAIVLLVTLVAVYSFLGMGLSFYEPNPTDQWDGLAYTLWIDICLILILSGIYLFFEGRATEVEVQKKFHYGLSLLFVMVGCAIGVIALYSVGKLFNEPLMQSLFPPYGIIGGSRGDAMFAIALATFSSPYIMLQIEKYIKNSKKFVITKLLIVSIFAGIACIVCAYIQHAIPSLETEDWWTYLSYGLFGFTALGLIITMIALPAIYFSLAKQTSGDLKRNSLTIAIGYLLTFIMIFMHMLRSELDFIPFNWVVFLLGTLIGAMILQAGYMRSTY
nr:hypothetical protein [Candidatus Sigynarchaeota archaeon]